MCSIPCIILHQSDPSFKFLISYDYILELLFLLESGISMIEVIKNKLSLLCQREGVKFKPDNNIASSIERFSVAVNAVLITGICFVTEYHMMYHQFSSIWFPLGQDFHAIITFFGPNWTQGNTSSFHDRKWTVTGTIVSTIQVV